MKPNCEYAGEKGCLCDVCQSVRKAIEEVEKIPHEEMDKMFSELGKLAENTIEL